MGCISSSSPLSTAPPRYSPQQLRQLKQQQFTIRVVRGSSPNNEIALQHLQNIATNYFPNSQVKDVLSREAYANDFKVSVRGEGVYDAEVQGDVTRPENMRGLIERVNAVVLRDL